MDERDKSQSRRPVLSISTSPNRSAALERVLQRVRDRRENGSAAQTPTTPYSAMNMGPVSANIPMSEVCSNIYIQITLKFVTAITLLNCFYISTCFIFITNETNCTNASSLTL